MKYNFLQADSETIPITPNDITYIEEKYGIRFPEKLRNYYIEHNGQKIHAAFMDNGGILCWVLDMYAIKDPVLPLEKLLERQKLQGYPVRQMIPFAHDGGGGIYYCHMITGTIYLSYLNGDDSFITICSNIGQFFNILNEAYQWDEDSPYDISEIIRSDDMDNYNFLPLGSIVLLKGGTRKVMIIARGLNVKKGEDTYFFDYGGVLYPEGLTGDQMVYFDHDGIVKVYFHGYSDDEDDVMVTSLNEYLNNHPNVNRADPQTWNSEA